MINSLIATGVSLLVFFYQYLFKTSKLYQSKPIKKKLWWREQSFMRSYFGSHDGQPVNI